MPSSPSQRAPVRVPPLFVPGDPRLFGPRPARTSNYFGTDINEILESQQLVNQENYTGARNGGMCKCPPGTKRSIIGFLFAIVMVICEYCLITAVFSCRDFFISAVVHKQTGSSITVQCICKSPRRCFSAEPVAGALQLVGEKATECG